MIIRAATVDDLDALIALDRACFDRSWTADAYRDELRRPQATVDVIACDCHGLAAAVCTWIVGDEGEILRVATHPEHRRQGLGRALIHAFASRAEQAGCVVVHLEVARSNVAARALYAAAGFVVTGERRGYYSDPPDDAVLMTCAEVRGAPPGGRGRGSSL